MYIKDYWKRGMIRMTKRGKKFNIIERKIPQSFYIDAGDGGGTLTDEELEELKKIEPPPPEPRETRSVLGEILEAFGEIAYSFNGMGIAFSNFGKVIQSEADNLGTQMKKSTNNIKYDIDNVVSKFADMGKTLANNLERID